MGACINYTQEHKITQHRRYCRDVLSLAWQREMGTRRCVHGPDVPSSAAGPVPAPPRGGPAHRASPSPWPPSTEAAHSSTTTGNRTWHSPHVQWQLGPLGSGSERRASRRCHRNPWTVHLCGLQEAVLKQASRAGLSTLLMKRAGLYRQHPRLSGPRTPCCILSLSFPCL